MTPLLISASTTEPILVEEAGENLRAQHDGNSPPTFYEGELIERLISVARQACEEYLELSLVAKTWEVAADSFCCGDIELPYGPVRSIVSVTYVNTDGDDTVVAADQYRISPYGTVPTLRRAYNVSWPSDARTDLDSVRVRYTAGYPSADSPPQEVPELIRQAMHLYIGHYFEHREAVIDGTLMELPLGAKHLLDKMRTGLGV